MEAKKLIPYSVHLREDIYLKLKAAAGYRRAAGMVRDAITMLIEGDDTFNAGYNKAIKDVINVVQENQSANAIAIEGQTIAQILNRTFSEMIVTQSVKGNSNGKKKS
jgi:hypothetical protein